MVRKLFFAVGLFSANLFSTYSAREAFVAQIDGKIHVFDLEAHDDLTRPILPDAACFRDGLLSLRQVSPLSIILTCNTAAFEQTNETVPGLVHQRAMSMLKAPALLLAGLIDQLKVSSRPDPEGAMLVNDMQKEADLVLASYFSSHPQMAWEGEFSYYSRCATDISRRILQLTGMPDLQISYLMHLANEQKLEQLMDGGSSWPSSHKLTEVVEQAWRRIAAIRFEPCLRAARKQLDNSVNYFAQFSTLIPGSIECLVLEDVAAKTQATEYEGMKHSTKNLLGSWLGWPMTKSALARCKTAVQSVCGL